MGARTLPKAIEVKQALTELRAFASQMGFHEAACGLTTALARLPADEAKTEDRRGGAGVGPLTWPRPPT